ncbi:MAG: chromosomal replication initiator protein DnaA [Muribaculaceae bacterium]|nr:chromosomal replication initiator protein DnaA [Muribaculaceae bacterium]
MDATPKQRWCKCLEIIKDNIPEPQYKSWFEPIECYRFEDNVLTLHVPSPYFKDVIESRYARLVVLSINKVFGGGVKLKFHYYQVQKDESTGVTMSSSNQSSAVIPRADTVSNPFYHPHLEEIDSQLNPSYTFENYCSGTSNHLARSIGEAIASNPQCKTFNPLFLFGPTGVGKTHLMQAIGIGIKERNPETRVLYVTARLFENQYTTAVTRKKVNDFINFYQSIDVLILDDIQDFAGNKPGTQNAFFHIFNHLHQNQKQLILSSDTRPSQLDGLEARLINRFKWGMTAELERPDYDLRRSILTQKASQDGLDLSPEILEYIASHVTDSIRELEGVVVSLVAHATVMNRSITLDLAKTVLSNSIKINKRVINFEMITQEVASYYNIDPESIFTKSRKREISDARQMVMFLAKKHAKMQLTAIGTRLSRSHATVLYACNNIEGRIPMEKKLQEDISKIEEKILS